MRPLFQLLPQTGKRITIRPFELSDQADYFALRAHEPTMRHLGGPKTTPFAKQEPGIAALSRQRGTAAIELNASRKFIGYISLSVIEMGEPDCKFHMHPELILCVLRDMSVIPRGIGREAGSLVLRSAFSLLGYPFVCGVVSPTNLDCHAFLKDFGFSCTGAYEIRCKEDEWQRGHDHYLLTPEGYASSGAFARSSCPS